MRRNRSGERVRREWGRLLEVTEQEVGRTIAADAAIGADELVVTNGGMLADVRWVSINGQVTRPTGWDVDTETLTIADPLAAAASEGDRILVWLKARNTALTNLEALVDRDDVAGEPLSCTVRQGLADTLPVGQRDEGEGEDVQVEYDPDDEEWTLIAAPGLARVAGIRFAYDTFTLTGEGPQSLLLSATPRDNSEHVYANGVELHEGTDWSRDGSTLSLLATMDPTPRPGYVIDVRYAVLGQASKTAQILLPFKSAGWSYKIIGRTDATDYSAAAYNDSAWSVAAAAFGAGPTSRQPWPPATAWAVNGRIWLRRHDIPEATAYTIQGRVEDQVEVWWNGNYVGTFTNGNTYPSVEWSLEVPAEYVVAGLQTIAIRATDEAGGDATDAAFIDVQISGTPT